MRAEDRRQIAAAVAVQQIVDDGEAGVFDHAGRFDHLRRHGAVFEHGGDRSECGVGRRVQVAIKLWSAPPEREAAQHLAGMIPERRADLGDHDVARRNAAAGGKLRRHAKMRRAIVVTPI